jgi:hypothetical protein
MVYEYEHVYELMHFVMFQLSSMVYLTKKFDIKRSINFRKTYLDDNHEDSKMVLPIFYPKFFR